MGFWDEVECGSPIVELVKRPDHKQVFMYSAITWNRHMIHYNSAQANAEGHKDVVVQRALLGSYLAQMITDWVKDNGMLRRLEWKVLRSAFPGDVLTCKGAVVEKLQTIDEKRISCEVCITNQQGGIIAEGRAVITGE